jgi:Putative Actinobacterial Holin-X, holin superfamily III
MTASDQADRPSPAADASAPGEGERALQSLLADLWEHSETLIRQEIALAKAEYEVRVANAKVAVRRGVISFGLFHAAYLTTLATLVLALAEWLPPWLASLLIAIGAAAGASIFTWLGLRAAEAATAPPKQKQSDRGQHQLRRHQAQT